MALEQEAPRSGFGGPVRLAVAAVAVGLVVDVLALHRPIGLGVALGLGTVVLAVALPRRPPGMRPGRAVYWLGATALVLAAMLAVRSSPVLHTLNLAAVALLVAILSQVPAEGLGRWTLSRYLATPVLLGLDVAAGSTRLIARDLPAAMSEQRVAGLRAVGLGVVVAAPIVVVFTVLFAWADVTFAAYVEDLGSRSIYGSIASHVAGAGAVGLALAGVWHRASRKPQPQSHRLRMLPRLDPRSAVTVLAMLVVLFALFVLTQVIGHNPDLVTPLDYKQNARGGFFQLLAVAFLVLTVLLVFDALIRSGDGRRFRLFDRMAVILVALTAAVMVSAMRRMWLYVDERGLTELRLYTSVFMVWLGFVLVWFLATVLRNLHARFALGLLASGLAAVIALNVANPDAFIVRFNWERHVAGAGFGEMYNSTLSADSIPTLAWIVENSPGERFCHVEARLAREQVAMPADGTANGLLGDSWSDARARAALAALNVPSGEGCDPAMLP